MKMATLTFALSLLALVLVLSACAKAPVPTQPCRAWPSAPDRELTTADVLSLAAEGKLSYEDCRARYDALRAAGRG